MTKASNPGSNRPSRGPTVAAVIAAMAVAGGLYLWRRSSQPPAGRTGTDEGTTTETSSDETPSAPPDLDTHPTASATAHGDAKATAPVDRPQMDPAKREEVRRLIWEALTHAAPPEEAPPKRGAEYVLPDKPPWELPSAMGSDAAPAPPNGRIEPQYIQERVRNDFFPLARQCYATGLSQNPQLAGKVVFAFNIVGDAKTGGIVEAVDVLNESTLRDPMVIDCMRQSFLSTVFPPPAGGGEVTVLYPIIFSSDDD
jgi:hypothetical protein